MEPKNQIHSDEIEIDLVELIGVLMSKLWMIIIFGALAGVITFLLCVYVVTPKYESTTKMYIINRQSNETLTYSDLQTGTQLTKDYQELVTSRPVLEEVRSELSLDIDNDELIVKSYRVHKGYDMVTSEGINDIYNSSYCNFAGAEQKPFLFKLGSFIKNHLA